MAKHALLSASSAERWLNCTASALATKDLPDKGSKYAEEGTLAHQLCELYASNQFGFPPPVMEEVLHKSPYWKNEMIKCAEVYRDYIIERANCYVNPLIEFEVRVRYDNYVPEGFGTADCIIVGERADTRTWGVEIIDYKHGQGVPKYAEGNPQMRLYALGVLNTYYAIYGDAIHTVTMSIVQPRLDIISLAEMPLKELIDWGEEVVKPTAQVAYTGEGAEYKQGTWCQFCKTRETCKTRHKYYTALEDFKDLETGEWRAPNTLNDQEMGEALKRARSIASWVSDVESYVTEQLFTGKTIPGWKLVEGRSVRKFTDQDAAFDVLVKEGWKETMLYERKPLTLSAIEKMIGKKQFSEILGGYVDKPKGKPTLAPESDKRPAIDTAAADFAGIE